MDKFAIRIFVFLEDEHNWDFGQYAANIGRQWSFEEDSLHGLSVVIWTSKMMNVLVHQKRQQLQK